MPCSWNLFVVARWPQRLWAGLLALFVLGSLASCRRAGPDEFANLASVGKNQYDQGQAEKAAATFEKAVVLQPANADARLNLANAYLLANLNEKALQAALEVLKLDPNSPAARYVAGCAALRLSRFEEAVKYLQECRDIDPKVNAVSFQLARAHQNLGHYEEAAALFQEVVQWEPQHPAAHYLLSQVLLRLGRKEEAQQEIELHSALAAHKPAQASNPAFFERSVYTEARVPFVLEQPEKEGIPVTFSDATVAFFGADPHPYRAPVGMMDIEHRGQNDLLVMEGSHSFRLLLNTNGTFRPHGPALPALTNALMTGCLVGDLNNDRFQDAIYFSPQGVQVLKFAAQGTFTDSTIFAGLRRQTGLDGALVDLDLTGKLDLALISPTNRQARLLRNLGPMYFKDITATSGIPANLTGVQQIAVDDWNGDDLPDLFLAMDGKPPQILLKERGGLLAPTNSPAAWASGPALAVADLNNDYRNDLIIAARGGLQVILNGIDPPSTVATGNWQPTALKALDYDNDGWLDLAALGKGIRVWRNLGLAGFQEMTRQLGLDQVIQESVTSLRAADFDQDGDSDWVVSLATGQLKLLRNEGGHANHMLKLHLVGNRSNASALGVKVEVKAASWHVLRTVTELPVEIGLGKHEKPDFVKARWSDLAVPVTLELKADPKMVWKVEEIELPTGSCPYLYAWDGAQFRFVTDLLGSAPLGLPVAENRFVEADPEEYVSLGGESTFKPKDGKYLLQVTEELREVLYLDEAKLVVVDHPAGTRTCATSKMLPGKPFIPHEVATLRRPRPLLRAENHLGRDVTAELKEIDGRQVAPTRLRAPQLRGLAEPSHVTLDFGPLPVDHPLVLVLHGWLRFGGGMANMAASHHPDLPFPFPVLEVETPASSPNEDTRQGAGEWKPVPVTVGVPCGKTKTIMVDLSGQLPAGSRRLRLQTAFELYWDQIELWERDAAAPTRVTRLAPSETDLHWRGFSEFKDQPACFPLTPLYDQVRQDPFWRITPAGWCTRYGAVDELVAETDNALVLLNGGDELTLAFEAARLPPVSEGFQRSFYFYSVGWDKDSDFHVKHGATVGPLPFHGMDDQRYGQQPRPSSLDDRWMRQYNTRWVGPQTLSRKD